MTKILKGKLLALVPQKEKSEARTVSGSLFWELISGMRVGGLKRGRRGWRESELIGALPSWSSLSLVARSPLPQGSCEEPG